MPNNATGIFLEVAQEVIYVYTLDDNKNIPKAPNQNESQNESLPTTGENVTLILLLSGIISLVSITSLVSILRKKFNR